MLYFDETVSYLRPIGDVLMKTTLVHASWREQELIAMDSGAVNAQRVVTMRYLPAGASLSFIPKTGDYIVRGDVSPRSLDELRAMPHAQIIAVRSNLRGQTAHWVVSAV